MEKKKKKKKKKKIRHFLQLFINNFKPFFLINKTEMMEHDYYKYLFIHWPLMAQMCKTNNTSISKKKKS